MVKGITTDRNIKQKLWNSVSGDLCAGPFWPLTLELVHLDEAKPDWLATIGEAPSPMRLLHDAKVSIIDWNALPKVFNENEPDDTPDYAIEDYGSDYGEDHGSGQDEDEDEDEDAIFPWAAM